MSTWVLLVAFISTQWVNGSAHYPTGIRHGVAMQEFSGLSSCQHASIELQKIAPDIRVVCVPKESK